MVRLLKGDTTIKNLNQFNDYDQKSMYAFSKILNEEYPEANKNKKILFFGLQRVVNYFGVLSKYRFLEKNVKVVPYEKAARYKTSISKYHLIILSKSPHMGKMAKGENSIIEGIKKEAKKFGIECYELENLETSKTQFEIALKNYSLDYYCRLLS